MVASRRDSLVTLQRATVVTDTYGGETPTWVDLRKEWARVTYGTASERREAVQTQAIQSATFDLPDNELTRGLKATDRILWNGVTWDIAAPGIRKSAGEFQFTTTGAVS
jgi:SPP1 family predicted phage head-tail adaptor